MSRPPIQRRRRHHTPEEARAYLALCSRRRDDGCLDFTLAHNGDGYCQTTYRGRITLVHRLAYEVHVGPIPAGLTIDHLCGNRRCVEPAHLTLATLQENVARRAPRVPGAPSKSRARVSTEAHRRATRRWRAKVRAAARRSLSGAAQ